MKQQLGILVAAVLLVSPAFAWEKIGREVAKLRGNVKIVRTKTSILEREFAEWAGRGEPFEEVEEIPDPSKSVNKETEDPDEDPGLAEIDPIEAKQSEGYDAGYGTSHAGSGFYRLDGKDNIIEAVHYSAKHELIGRDFYKYDSKENEIEKTFFHADGTLVSRRITTYDSEGNRIEEVYYLSDGTVQRRSSWTYDSNNNATQETLLEAGVLKYKLTYSYKYDQMGNWIRRVKITENFESEHPKSEMMEIVERAITYR
ncbi:MAG TPA: hypothetical protein VN687_12775 [Blastocatellia bacterium]|nr:hypothetical protein [Blastocatellia bacterium]